MKLLKFAGIILSVVLIAIIALWVWICFNPGVIYCRGGVLYMSELAVPPL